MVAHHRNNTHTNPTTVTHLHHAQGIGQQPAMMTSTAASNSGISNSLASVGALIVSSGAH